MARIDLGNVLTTAITSAATQIAADPGNKMVQKDVPDMVDKAREVAGPIIKEAQAHYDYATNNESLIQSYSFTGGLTAVVGALGTIVEKLWDGYQPAVDNPGLVLPVVTVIGGFVVLYGRLIASKPIGQ